MTKEELKKAIAEKKEELESFELDVDDYVDEYEEALNSEGSVKVCGMEFEPADILREMDSTAYRCGLNDYVDSIEKEDTKAYKDIEEELEELENKLEEEDDEI